MSESKACHWLCPLIFIPRERNISRYAHFVCIIRLSFRNCHFTLRYASSTYLPVGVLSTAPHTGYNQPAVSQYASQPYLARTMNDSEGQERSRKLKKRPSLPPSVNAPATKRSFSLSRLFHRGTKSTPKPDDSVDMFKSRGSFNFNSTESMAYAENTLGQSVDSLPQSLDFDTETDLEEAEAEAKAEEGTRRGAVRSISFLESARYGGETAVAAVHGGPASFSPFAPEKVSGEGVRLGAERMRSQTTHFVAASSCPYGRSEAKQLPSLRSASPLQNQQKLHKNRRALPVPRRWRGSDQITDSSLCCSSQESINRSQILTAFPVAPTPPARSTHKPPRHRPSISKEDCLSADGGLEPAAAEQQQRGYGKPQRTASPARHRTLRRHLFIRSRKKADSSALVQGKQAPLKATALEPLHCELTSSSVSLGRVHFSLAGGRRACFFLTAPVWRKCGWDEPQKVMTTNVFCAATETQQDFWLKW
ncbi:hypothetical protein AAHC03_01782 [Spirometra sp. Aus1]